MPFATELEGYEMILCGHLAWFERGLRKLKPEHWDWTPNQAAPTPRTVAVHAWQWLICDRYHITLGPAVNHPRVPDPPESTEAFCDAFAEERQNWSNMLLSMDPQDLTRPLYQFDHREHELSVRFFILHMIQNTIYKNGQFSEVFYALGYDGEGPYEAPFPNPIYEEIRQASEV